jgi:hypothetical protein
VENLETCLTEVQLQGQPKTRYSKDLDHVRLHQTRIRTAGLPNPRPIGLQSRYSILPGSPPLGLCQAIALFQTHTQRDTRPSAAPATPRLNTHPLTVPPDPRPPGSPPPICAGSQTGASPTARGDTHSSLRAHCPSGPTEPQASAGRSAVKFFMDSGIKQERKESHLCLKE